jgi:uncharacterized protein
MYFQKMNRETIIEELKKLKPILSEKYSVKDIALFGSYSRNEETPQSDIDILIHFEKPSFDSLCNSFDILQEAFGTTTVQVVSKGGIKPHYFEAIKRDLLYA